MIERERERERKTDQYRGSKRSSIQLKSLHPPAAADINLCDAHVQ